MLVELTRAAASREERHYAFEQVGRGAAGRRLVCDLVANGLDRPAAVALVAEAEGVKVDLERAAAGRQFFIGLLWCVGGVVLTVVSGELSRSSGSGYSTIFWGAIVIGGIQCLQGITNSLRLTFRRGAETEKRANFAERCAGRGMLLGLAGGAAVGVVWGAAENGAGGAFAGFLLGPIPGLLVGVALGLGYALVKKLTANSAT